MCMAMANPLVCVGKNLITYSNLARLSIDALPNHVAAPGDGVFADALYLDDFTSYMTVHA